MPLLHDRDLYGLPPARNGDEPDRFTPPPSHEEILLDYHDGPSPKTEARPASPIKEVLAAIDDTSLGVSDRVELIERIKRGESPTWLPNQTLENYFQELKKPSENPSALSCRCRTTAGQSPTSQEVRLNQEVREAKSKLEDKLNSPSEIERPKSALHAGDFTEDTLSSQEPLHTLLTTGYDTTQGLPAWHGGAIQSPFGDIDPEAVVTPKYYGHAGVFPLASASIPFPSVHRNFNPSLPTSPLARSFTNADLDISSSHDYVGARAGKPQGSRRHTLPPHALLSFQSSPPGLLPSYSQLGRTPVPIHKEARPSYHSHHARRSLTSSLVPPQQSVPCIPVYGHGRRSSVSSDTSPLHLAPMVGSYEESILRGRMSTAPSKPLDFMAQIGVLGLGKCKPNLRCPAHVAVPFPAVFYSYAKASVGRSSILDDGPSPYVGLIDLENSIAKNKVQREEVRRKSVPYQADGHNNSHEDDGKRSTAQSIAKAPDNDLRLRIKKQRRSHSPKSPPGGSYRIPQTGQLQIVIKNPNKTAVKLFLVPYDLKDMPPGTKTFIRQRSYSTGPVIENPLSSKTSKETGGFESKASGMDELKDRPTLRYLIHLHICSPSRDRFYLYKSIRVVFANRVPDGKEKLRNEIQLPEPRYTAYKPGRELSIGNPFGVTENPTSGKVFQRRSSAFVMGPEAYDALDGIPSVGQRVCSDAVPLVNPVYRTYRQEPTLSFGRSGNISSQAELVTMLANEMDLDQSQQDLSRAEMHGCIQRDVAWHQAQDHAILTGPLASRSGTDNECYTKLNKGEAGYGGHLCDIRAGVGGEPGEGLLARKLKRLDVQHDLKERNESH
ncbi:MAG: hypothetical protein M1816_006332 [Peltula sp. TS41687]|nr:MAG: hypothetical protein M1816_006332 [Peltula sp. TS41687]